MNKSTIIGIWIGLLLTIGFGVYLIMLIEEIHPFSYWDLLGLLPFIFPAWLIMSDDKNALKHLNKFSGALVFWVKKR